MRFLVRRSFVAYRLLVWFVPDAARSAAFSRCQPYGFGRGVSVLPAEVCKPKRAFFLPVSVTFGHGKVADAS